MENYTYNWEVKDLLTQFLQAFDGAVIKRYDINRNAGDQIGVRYVYSPKQRVLHDLVNRAQHITLPVVAYYITGISRDVKRVFNKLDGAHYPGATTSKSNYKLQPVPVNIEVGVSILTRYQTDMDQILSNFVPYNDPYFVISWTEYGTPNIEIRSEVLWSGTLGLSYPMDLDSSVPARVTCDTAFTIKGWLFKAEADPVGRIFKVDMSFNAVSALGSVDSLLATTALNIATNNPYTETFTISARPIINFSSIWMTPIGLSGADILYGENFSETTSVWLSGSPDVFLNTTTFSEFANDNSLSAIYPNITGVVSALSYTINSDNKLTINYPAPQFFGNFDIIVVNPAGYAIMTQDVYNPNMTTQVPYVSGIQVLDVSNVNYIYFESGGIIQFISGDYISWAGAGNIVSFITGEAVAFISGDTLTFVV